MVHLKPEICDTTLKVKDHGDLVTAGLKQSFEHVVGGFPCLIRCCDQGLEARLDQGPKFVGSHGFIVNQSCQ